MIQTWRSYNLRDIPATPWLNGGGTTQDLYTLPAVDGTDATPASDQAWTLRLSVATIDRDGPFSNYPGVTRWFAVLSGQGVVLRHPDGREDRLTMKSPPLSFDGAAPPTASLVQGATRDLNLMLRGVEGSLEDATDRPTDAPFALFAASAGYLLTPTHQMSVRDETLIVFGDDRPSQAAYSARGWWLHLAPPR